MGTGTSKYLGGRGGKHELVFSKMDIDSQYPIELQTLINIPKYFYIYSLVIKRFSIVSLTSICACNSIRLIMKVRFDSS